MIASWFLASRAFFWRAGVSPDPTAPAWLWQVLSLQDLADRPLESLWFLHSQPPLYNAIIALCLQLPGSPATWLHGIWIAFGYGLLAVMFKSFRLAGIPRGLSHLAVVAFAINPSLVLYENFLFYTYLEAFCILGAKPARRLFTLRECARWISRDLSAGLGRCRGRCGVADDEASSQSERRYRAARARCLCGCVAGQERVDVRRVGAPAPGMA